MILPDLRRRSSPLLSLALIAALAAGCDGAPDAEAQQPIASPSAGATLPPATRLAARAALAQDQYYSAIYRFAPSGGSPAGTARVERAKTGFRLDIQQPADATHVERTTVVVRTAAGTFYCRLTAAGKACVTSPPTGVDPRAHHAFTDWLAKLADPAAALSVAMATPPSGITGDCFSVEGTTASLDPPVDPGLYCFDSVGRITALRLGAGLFTAVQVGGAPTEVTVPAPVGGSLPAAAAPSPTPSPTPSTRLASPAPKGKASSTPRHSAQPR